MSSAQGPSRAAAHVRRVDDRLGLAVLRVGLSGRSLVTYARDHVTVRTPSRPDFVDGNTLDLLAPPAPGDLAGWIERFTGTISVTGAPHVQLRWEYPAEHGGDPGLEEAARQQGLACTPHEVALLDTLVPSRALGDVEVVGVAAPSAIPGGATDRRWHAASVLYRYATGDGPADFRGFDAGEAAWRTDVQRELAAAGRASVWVAMRHGGPVARCTVVHDRQGLVAVEDVITHPAQRGGGVAAMLVSQALTEHLRRDPSARVGVGYRPGSPAARLAARLGFQPHAAVTSALTAHGG